MHGGLKVYRGSPTAARNYVEADRSRADDYYLAEGTGVADRYVSSDGRVQAQGTLDGDAYESWVAGHDPDTGAPKGRLRTDAAGVRFVEVVVNGPKSWSLAAALHPDIAAAYDGAQDRAAAQVIGWLADHATTRIGPRGRQVQVPVQELEAVTVRHYTSRAGDPHRHLHLQVNARVFAQGRWRGLHTVGVRDSLDAINGIGHAAVLTDPQFRAALTNHGYTVDAASGEVVELAAFVGPFSARTAQITRNMDRYEAQWRTAHPGAEPGPRLRRSWDAQAWAHARPDKVIPTDGAELAARWVEELHGLGYRDPHPPTAPPPTATPPPPSPPPSPPPGPTSRGEVPPRVGEMDRDGAVITVLARLGGRRSAWNAADVRGEVEQWIARTGLIAEAGVRLELAEDLTDRVLASCVPLLTRSDGTAQMVPEHIRTLTSRDVLAVEDDLTTRLIARAETSPSAAPPAITSVADLILGQRTDWASGRVTDPAITGRSGEAGLDAAQQAVAAALAGGSALVVVEGAAGVGKTTTLTAARAALERRGRRLVVATPTLKAATVAAAETGAPAYSAAWLVHQHGYRWNSHSSWRRLHAGETDPQTGASYQGPLPGAVLSPGDVLLVDEAGMLDQDTARALVVVADESHARLALVGDRHQLPAVGRGGVLDLAARWAHPQDCLTLDTVHRFHDQEYAALTLAMRTGEHPTQVFDALLARGKIHLHASEAERTQLLAATASAGRSGEPAHEGTDDPTGEATGGGGGGGGGLHQVLVIADTREQVAALNATIRDRLVTAGSVDDTHTVTTQGGERIGVGDRVATRRNDRDLDVANRDTWTVSGIHPHDGTVDVTSGRGNRRLPDTYAREHLELAYATTVYGAQGDTVDSAHLVLGEHTGAAAAYVAMTRGRTHNIAHVVAETVEEARDQWAATFTRDRADLGPAQAARRAAEDIDRYGTLRPLDRVLADLRQAWATEQGLAERVSAAEAWRDRLVPVAAIRRETDPNLADLHAVVQQTWDVAAHARTRFDQVDAAVTADADRLTHALHMAWQRESPAALRDAHTVQNGAGPLGLYGMRVRRASRGLQAWADSWRPVLPTLPNDVTAIAAHVLHIDSDQLHQATTSSARHAAEQAHPDHPALQHEADVATRTAAQAEATYTTALDERDRRLAGHRSLAYMKDPAGWVTGAEQQLDEVAAELKHAQARVHALELEPAIQALPHGRLQTEHDSWQRELDAQQVASRRTALTPAADGQAPAIGAPHDRHQPPGLYRRTPPRGISP